jgi:hypothetical protein
MRQSPPLAPSAPKAPVCIVLDDFGDLGRAYRETDEADAAAASVIDNLLRGEYSRPVRVIAFNTDEGYARDVSREIARAVVERAAREGRTVGGGTRLFLADHLSEAELPGDAAE